MKLTLLRSIAAVSVAVAGAASAGELSVFKQPNFAGPQLNINSEMTNLKGSGFYDQISSVVVKSGRWEVCTQPHFQGDCAILSPGEYPALEQRLNHRIESVREVTRTAARSFDDRPAWRGQDRGPAVELFGRPEFRGRTMEVDVNEIDNLVASGREPRVSSLVIHEGRWQVCTDPGFEGECRVLQPGRYPRLGYLNNQIGSIRRVG